MIFIPDETGDPSGATLTRARGYRDLLRVSPNVVRIEAEGQTPIVIARQAFVESLPVRFIGEATAEFVQALEHINLLFSLVPAAPGGSLDSNMIRAQKGTLPRDRGTFTTSLSACQGSRARALGAGFRSLLENNDTYY